jgi:hypothetical protein
MRSRVQVFASLLAAAFVLATPAMALAPDTSTTGTIELTGGGVAVGVGVGWGSGTLHFRGETYKLKTSGLSAVDIGVSRYSASGTVTGLNQASDIVGVYQAAELGATVAGGGAILSMKNDKGVHIKANATTRGLRFTAAPKGIKIAMAK